jgi:hypothetical protein
MDNPIPRPERGQILPLFAFTLVALLLGVAVVVDGGYAYAQRRHTQNAADFAAMAGTRIVGQKLTGRPTGSGTSANVRAAIQKMLTAGGAELVSARFVNEHGQPLADVMTAGTIPALAFGVTVEARSQWRPFLIGIIGGGDWLVSAEATAFTPGRSLGGGVLPLGIQDTRYDSLVDCPLVDINSCIDQNLTSGKLYIPGGFAWLKFGIHGQGGKCDWSPSLGMIGGGCQASQTFLDEQIGPPGDSYGCCTSVGLAGNYDRIGSLTGNEWGDLSFHEDNQIPVWVPIWDHAGGTGSNAYYHIVGFGALIITGDNEHAKWLEGASISNACAEGTTIPGHDYCTTPGGAFTIDVTGEVRLVR